ncbi:MAG TPA: chromosomal replication initiator protein DnaA [Dehalococcoidia bacterium]|nr:chromosomal replication initiator protein DnaA [Dehalococcoidia bacterium]
MRARTAADIWQAALEELQGKVSPANYNTWLKNTVGLSQQDGSLIVGVPSTFVTESLEKRLHPLIEQTVSGITGRPLKVQFQVHLGDGSGELGPTPPTPSPRRYSQRASQPKFNRRYTFETFIVGSSNRLAHAAAQRVAQDPGGSYNPLFVYSGVGLGKTHLLHAIGWVALRSCPKVMYVTAEQFTNEFISAIREGKSEDFRNKYRSVDVLLLDDVQFIAGKEQTQEGLFHTFNDLHNENRQIVLSCDRPPRTLTLLEDRLRSRFEGGLIVDMQPPDLETRIAILQIKAKEQKTAVPAEVLNQIAHRIHKNIRELEGALNRVLAFARLIQEPMTPELVAKALAEITTDTHRRTLTVAAILSSVAAYYGLTLESLQGAKRDRPLTVARQMAMYLLREELQSSWTQIGKELGNRDHSTILHGYQKIANDINTDAALRRDLVEIREGLYSKAV